MPQFSSFVVFAEMRTGSNFLEANLNALEGVNCLGEAFNPHFISYPNRDSCLGISQAERDRDPGQLLARMQSAPGLNGFRFFHDHDPRALEHVLKDPACAKIVLTRNPAESYVSWKIAQATGQWKLTDVRRRRAETVAFDADEFAAHLGRLQAFQVRLLNALQVSGQTAFYLDYEDLQSVAVMNGLAAFLGVAGRLETLDRDMKVQNPSALADKVENFAEMEDVLARLDRFNLSRTPNFEPRRGPQVPSFVAAAGILYMPIKGGPEAAVTRWMATLDKDGVIEGFSQKSLRQWKRAHPGHRSFAVLRHPVARAHAVFCDKILSTGPGAFAEIRKVLRQRFNLPIPEVVDAGYAPHHHKAAFLAFLDFLKINLSGQSGLRVDPHWATQSAMLEGMAQFALPDQLVREDEITLHLPALARRAGGGDHPLSDPAAGAELPYALNVIYDAEVEARVAEVYQRDYMTFGFGPWQGVR
ncbi:nodulation protein NodH [Pseudooceanicola sediminis]|uniref:Nodulation protein NodH n=1 Tax=Pseudooceanicola sediminis TaxID=2211117 RepID=A0A399J4Y4_9RHOB|nr:nodulation protein NodH [Pseudooceanicola sediminis]KAA2315390.1 nodulation protein NodH [Puniceibacterium sp. HSS470]RII40404.1 nodulation protein NodH [Pseudooceanicola sediminis]|tara:strand:+ start:108017 stop:109432 length:1416 start_codon:yes stop_codon:yes gene_type:complete